jgi:acetyltransferase-like isoleucine patch superfamily enzyme
MQIHRFPNGSFIVAEELHLGVDVQVGPNTQIRTKVCHLADGVHIGSDNRFLVAQRIEIGTNAIIGHHNDITARSFKLGEYVYWDSNVIVGHGGKFSPDAHLSVGSYSMICARITLNVNHAIRIGAYVGIGEDVAIWTHGSYLPILEGFPADFGPVHIGDKVWLPAKSTVLPNRKIGNNVVIGTNSLINKDLPDGCLAGGIPVRVIRENLYPSVDAARNEALVTRILEDYAKLAAYKELNVNLAFDSATNRIHCNQVAFHLSDPPSAEGNLTETEEDFRDFLRRRGIKIFTGKPFRSILPPEYRSLLDFPINS